MHYFLAENSHSMDAAVVNKCEAEFLRIVEEISKKLNIELVVEITPLAEGGLSIIQDLRALPRDTKLAVKILIAGAFLQYFVAQIPNIGGDSIETKTKQAALLQYHYDEAVKNSYASIFKTEYEKKLKEIQERNRAQNIFDNIDFDAVPDVKGKADKGIIQTMPFTPFVYDANESVETVSKLVELSEERDINRAKSNFYKNLYKYDKVESLEFTSYTPSGLVIGKPVKVESSEFRNFIIETDAIEDGVDPEAVIQIISPVILKGKFTWKGFYKGEKIDFYMIDNVFRGKLKKISIRLSISTL